jgi:hypothetical protein
MSICKASEIPRMSICKASEIPRNEAYIEVRRSDEG